MIKFEEATHTYTCDGAKVPSVSTIINDLLGSDYSKIDPFYANRGTAVHKAIELHLHGNLNVDSLDDHVLPYFKAWCKFEAETNFTVEKSELKVFSKRLWVAGTLDLIGTIAGQRFLLDIKTGSKQKWHALQTAGYCLCLSETDDGFEPKRGSIYLSKDKSYKLEPHINRKDFMTFESMSVVYNKRGEYR